MSISLVPPLCVVGVTLSIGEIAAASGALLLFITNFFSILLAGGGVLALLGLAGAATKDLNRHRQWMLIVLVKKFGLFLARGGV